jgi:hypothetical protein
MKLCKDCDRCDQRYLSGATLCSVDYINPVTGDKITLTVGNARANEWACGVEGKGFKASRLEHVLLSDLALEHGEDRVREWFDVWGNDVLDDLKCVLHSADEFRRVMSGKYYQCPTECDACPLYRQITKLKEQCREAQVHGTSGSLPDELIQ